MAHLRLRTAVVAVTMLAVTAAGCGTKDDEPGGNGGPPLRSDSATAPATTAPTGTTISLCPTETVLDIQTRDGQRTLRASRSYASVTADTTASITITNYDLAESEASKVLSPTLTGDQLAVNAIVSAIGGAKLSPGIYTPTRTSGATIAGASPSRQLNNYTVWSSAGREIVSGFNQIEPEVTISSIDRLRVCGELATPEARGRFAATRI